jgi:hypothetical protein
MFWLMNSSAISHGFGTLCQADKMTVWEPVSQVLAALNAAKTPIQVSFPLAPGRPTSYQRFSSSHYRTWQLQTE